jgi:uncharacterized membrane protein
LARKPPARPTNRPPPAKSPPSDPQDDGLRQELDSRLAPLVPAAGKRLEVVNTAIEIVREEFSGPIAHPRHLREYEEIVPGSAERIIAMAEKQQNHNIDIQRDALEGALKDERLGMILGCIILVVIVIAAYVAGTVYNNNILAGILIAGAVLNVVALLINRSRK